MTMREWEMKRGLRLPAICAPMFLVSTPALVGAACAAGIVGAIPRHNARTIEQFEIWLRELSEIAQRPGAGPLAVNLQLRMTPDEMDAHIRLCARYGVELIITANGNPAEMVRRAHDIGAAVLHDVADLRHADKAIAVGVDGLNAVCAGGGGHSGLLSPLVFIPKLRTLFDGVIVMAGAVATGHAIRAAEVLGADFAYLGTRFIASREAGASKAYKQLLVDAGIDGLSYTDAIAGVHANWLRESMRLAGINPDALPRPAGKMRYDHLPEGVRPWRDIWSAGQAVALIDDVPAVSEIVDRLCQEYAAASAGAPSGAPN